MARYRATDASERRTAKVTVQLAPTERTTAGSRRGARGQGPLATMCGSSACAVEARLAGRGGARRNPDAKALADELRAIGNNINQLARVANQTGEIRREAELAFVIDRLVATMDRVIRLMMPVRRRQGGERAQPIRAGRGQGGRQRQSGPRRAKPGRLDRRAEFRLCDQQPRAAPSSPPASWNSTRSTRASRTRRCEKDAVHLTLAWRVGEAPSREEMEEAAASALKALGMENAKAIWAAHRDEQHAHLHIVASKIDPDTGRAYNLKSDYLKLSKWAQQLRARAWRHRLPAPRRKRTSCAMRSTTAIRRPVLEAMTRQRATFTGARS